MNGKIEALENKAAELRQVVLEMCIRHGGHLASSFSCMEILVALYQGGRLNVSPTAPDDPERDRFILSKGHAETVLYAVLADLGYLPVEWLRECYRFGDCLLGGHPDHKTPGVEITSGALGHGLGIGAGLAAAAILDGKLEPRTVVLMGDAECTEGSVWEAGLFAAQRGLGNLVGIVDRNRIGSLDYTRNYAGLGDIAQKWRAFGWEVLEVDGHDLAALGTAFDYAWARRKAQPLMLVADTVKGKGVSFIENEPIWHVKALCNPDEINQARQELGCGCGGGN
jgi:transketolase